MVLTSRRNYGCRIQEIHISGMRALVLENKTLRVTVLLDKGADIIEFLHKPTDTDWMGISPMGLRNPQEFQVSIPGRNGHLIDSYQGGWQIFSRTAEMPALSKGLNTVNMEKRLFWFGTSQ